MARSRPSRPSGANWTAALATSSGWPARPWREIPRSSSMACGGRLRPGSATGMEACGAGPSGGRMGKPLGESELGAPPATGTNPALPGPGGLARALNAAYDQAGITGVLVWPPIGAIPPGMPHENRGLIWADRPWDGYYYVTPLTWVIAQTTQFTAPGWRYAAGANGRLPAGGASDTFLARGRSAWSIVAQSSIAIPAQ